MGSCDRCGGTGPRVSWIPVSSLEERAAITFHPCPDCGAAPLVTVPAWQTEWQEKEGSDARNHHLP